jgi:hypothetical protein
VLIVNWDEMTALVDGQVDVVKSIGQRTSIFSEVGASSPNPPH